MSTNKLLKKDIRMCIEKEEEGDNLKMNKSN
jgi:hypothetical protein